MCVDNAFEHYAICVCKNMWMLVKPYSCCNVMSWNHMRHRNIYLYTIYIYTQYVVVTTRPTVPRGISDIAKLPEARWSFRNRHVSCRFQVGKVQDLLQMGNSIGKSVVFWKAKGGSFEKNYPSCIAILNSPLLHRGVTCSISLEASSVKLCDVKMVSSF